MDFRQDTNGIKATKVTGISTLQARVLLQTMVVASIIMICFLVFSYWADNLGGVMVGAANMLLLFASYTLVRMGLASFAQHFLMIGLGPILMLLVFIGGHSVHSLVSFFPVLSLMYLLYRGEKAIYFYMPYFGALLLLALVLMLYSPEPKLLNSPMLYSYFILAVCLSMQLAILSLYQKEILLREEQLRAERKNIEAYSLLMQASLESSIDGICIVDQSQHTICANKKFLEMWSLSTRSVKGETFAKTLQYLQNQMAAPRDFQSQLDALDQASTTLVCLEVALQDGRFFEIHIQNLQLSVGAMAGRVFNCRDITQRKQTEQKLVESEALFRSLFEEIPIGVVLDTHHEGTLRHSNAQFRKMLGYTQEELVEKKVEDITHPDDRGVHKDNYRKVWRGELELFDMEKKYLRKDGSIVWAHTTVAVARDAAGKVKYDIAMIQDITQKKLTQDKIKKLLAALQAQNEELEEKVNLRTQRLQEANQELLRSNKELEQFAYVASHDLQEPLRTIRNFIQLLQRRDGAQISDEGKEYIDFIVDGTGRMSQLIRNLLEYSKVGRKDIVFTLTDANEMVALKLRDLTQRIKDSNAELWIHELPQKMSCEPHQLGLVFYNLLANALKFNKNEKAVVILSHQEREEDWLFSVKDNGIGIEPQYQEKVFEIFKRLNRREEFEGTGIGLALCKRIINRHEGKIWFDSSLNKGTTFYFTISKKLGITAMGVPQN